MTPQLHAAAPGAIGFRRTTALDESPQTARRTRLAVSQAKEGDRDAVRYLYITYAHNIYGYVRSIVRDDHEAEDVTQHVFAKVMTTITKYDDRGVPFFAWLLRLARNVAIDHLRSNRLTPTENVIDRERTSGVDLDRADAFRVALAALPDDQRHVVLLRHLVGLTPGEIADQLGRSESSVHGLHHRGRRALQRELERLDSTPCTRGTPSSWRRDRAAAAAAAACDVSRRPSLVARDAPRAVHSALDRRVRGDVNASPRTAMASSTTAARKNRPARSR